MAFSVGERMLMSEERLIFLEGQHSKCQPFKGETCAVCELIAEVRELRRLLDML